MAKDLLSLADVIDELPISRSGFLNGVSQGIYAQPIRWGKRVFWRHTDIEAMKAQMLSGNLPVPGRYIRKSLRVGAAAVPGATPAPTAAAAV